MSKYILNNLLLHFISESQENGDWFDTSKAKKGSGGKGNNSKQDKSDSGEKGNKSRKDKSGSGEKGNKSPKDESGSGEKGMRSGEVERENKLYDGVPKCLFKHRDAIINTDA